MNNKIYLDNASTTSLNAEVLNEMLPYYVDYYGNASSIHSFGRVASSAIDKARDTIAKSFNASSGEVYFTSGGTESNNWAIKGVALANAHRGKHIIVSEIEHPSIMETCQELVKLGFEVSYLPVDDNGLVIIPELIHAIRPDTTLVSIMAVNNEVGTIQNIKSIGSIVKDYEDIYFHTDAVQALNVMDIDVKDLKIDLMTISSHKIHGPKGVGCLYVRKGVKIDKVMLGGEQEFNKRGGTQNVAGIVGFAKAVELNARDLATNRKKITALSNYFMKKLKFEIDNITINGHPKQKSHNIINVSFNDIDGESVLIMLDLEGIAVSTGSACTAGTVKKSHVLQAMGKSDEEVSSAVRFSFGIDNTKEEIDTMMRTLENIVKTLRKKSPIYSKKPKKRLGVKNV